MTSAALSWGCAFLAFAPFICQLFLIAYKKAQLIIVVTTSAFAFLLSALLASLIWLIFSSAGVEHALLLLVPGVLSQFLFRCGFVALYHRVESVIQDSIERHEQQHPEEQGDLTESARLRLELNDWACGIAAGCGFGGMHAIMLYGTLLASESGNLGTLYQESCPEMPSLVLSALNAFFFSLLDSVWMLLTFFGLRRRLMFPASGSSQFMSLNVHHYLYGGWGGAVGNTRHGGNLALVITAVSHLVASLVTTPNNFENGCLLSLPLLGGVVLAMILFFWGGVSKIYLPEHQQRRGSEDGLLTEGNENSRHED